MSTKKSVSIKRSLPPKPSFAKPPAKKSKVVEPPPEEEVEKKEGLPRRKATIEDHIDNYQKLFMLLDSEIDRKGREKEKGTKSLRTIRKILTKMRKEVPQVTRSKSARKHSSLKKQTTSGLMMQFSISKELADFLKVSSDTRLSRVDVTRALCVYVHLDEDEKRDAVLEWKYMNANGKRNLQNPQDKKAIIPDKALSKLLRYDVYKKNVADGLVTRKVVDKETGKKQVVKVTTDALYYWVVPKLLGFHFLEEEPEAEEEEPEAEEGEPEAEEEPDEEEEEFEEEEDS